MAPRTPLQVLALSWLLARAGADRADSARSAAEGVSVLHVDARAHASVAKMGPGRWSAYEKVWEPLQEASNELEKSLEILMEEKLKVDEQVNVDEKELAKIQARLDENEQKNRSLQGQIDRLKAGRIETMRNLEKTMQEYPQFKANDDSTGGVELLERHAHKRRKGKKVKGHSSETFAHAQVSGNETHRQANRGRVVGNRTHGHARRGHAGHGHAGRVDTSPGRNQSSLLQGGPAWGGPVEAGAGTPNYEPLEETSDQVESHYAHLRDQLVRLSEQIADDEREKGNAEARQAANQRELNSLTSQLGMLRTGKHDSKLAMLRTLAAMAGAHVPEDPGVKVPEGEQFRGDLPNTVIDPLTGAVEQHAFHGDHPGENTNGEEKEGETQNNAEEDDNNGEKEGEAENHAEEDTNNGEKEGEMENNAKEDDNNGEKEGEAENNAKEDNNNGEEKEGETENNAEDNANGEEKEGETENKAEEGEDDDSLLQETPARATQDPRFYHALRQSAEAIDKHDGMLKSAADRIRQKMASDRALIEKLDERLTDNKAELAKVKDQIARLREGGEASKEEMRKTMETTAEKGLEGEAKVDPLAG